MHPQIKICGLTIPEQAADCARLGADAIGLVFYPPSPRNLELELAAEIAAALPDRVRRVGVFVNPEWRLLAAAIDRCGLAVVQLHGSEPPELAQRIQTEFSLKVIKALFTAKAPDLTAAGKYQVGGFLVECGKGPLPGGNAETWDWGAAADFARRYPMVLAGGLSPVNVAQAIQATLPAAVDASSGLESAPGHKDIDKVRRFIAAVRTTESFYKGQNATPDSVF
ncbi:MAG: phosphoribosylanthranilate isomerase [Desulfobacteraceae bacterium]|nr:phosphoribosylanthranilate isomerase [Desulfobacteraceae bacterium]